MIDFFYFNEYGECFTVKAFDNDIDAMAYGDSIRAVYISTDAENPLGP